MEFRPLDSTSEEWDRRIAAYPTKSLFHLSAWLNYLEKTQNGRRIQLEIVEGGLTIGYFAALMIQKGPFRILGSPLTGWTTESMGPVVDTHFGQEAFITALESYCHQERVDHIEISAPVLQGSVWLSRGYECQKGETPIVNLSREEDQMWKKLTDRKAVRKARQQGLIVEDATDPAFVCTYYHQLTEVFTRKKLVPTYPLARVEQLFRLLKPADLLFSLQVRYQDQVIATGLFPHDDHFMYFWGGASRQAFLQLRPNDLLHWSAMSLAGQRGIEKYHLGGGINPFKLKFGGSVVEYHRWFKSFSSVAKAARIGYYTYQKGRQAFLGFLQQKKAPSR